MEKFENKFHKKYVSGEGKIEEGKPNRLVTEIYRGMSYEDVLAEYRRYVKDPKAKLPEKIMEFLRITGKI